MSPAAGLAAPFAGAAPASAFFAFLLFFDHLQPLYYLLAAPIYAATGNVKWVQLLSLLFSVLTLLVIYRLLYVDKLLPDGRACPYAFLMACFLPQFVLFGLYVSNDTLAIFLGAIVVLQVVRFVATSTIWQAVLLALLVSLGLLTKATFLAFLPALFVLAGIRALAARIFGTEGFRRGAGFVGAGRGCGELAVRSELSRS